MRAHPEDLAEAPELAVLAVLDTTLDQAALALVAQHREIIDGDSNDLVGLPPASWVADVLISVAADLRRLVDLYRLAVLDDARHRANSVTSPASPRHAE